MSEKFFVTNYDRDELISMIREAFKEELNEIHDQQKREKDFSTFLSRQEVAKLLKI